MIGNSAANDVYSGTSAVVLPSHEVDATDQAWELQQLAALQGLVSIVSSSESAEQACRTLVTELQQVTGAELVTLALRNRRSGRYELLATSNRERLDPKAELTQAITAACQECAAREESAHWPPRDEHGRHALLAHRRLSKLLDGSSLLSLPLPDAKGELRGVCVISSTKNPTVTVETKQFLDAACVPLGSSLGLIQQARGNRFDRGVARLIKQVRSRRPRVVAFTLLAVLAIGMLPMRYHVKCHCEVQPVVRRFVAAPFDARLEKSFVEPGDVVAKGDLLARIDAQDIQWKLSAKQAEAHRVETELAGYVAAHESGKARIAQLELERIQVELDELEYMTEHLEIRSPLDGMVLLGDHAKLEGVPLERGKTLFEVAPLSEVVIEVEIPQDDVRFVEPGQLAKIRFDAYPLEPVFGQISRVHPRAEIREQNNVFVAEIIHENSAAHLRPGIRGVARVKTVFGALAWNYFHKPFSKALVWLGL